MLTTQEPITEQRETVEDDNQFHTMETGGDVLSHTDTEG